MKYFLLTLLLLPLFVNAQDEELDIRFPTAENYEDINDMDYFYSLADKVNIRSCPSITCKQVEQLKIGQKFLIFEESTDIQIINGVSAYWYQIKTTKNTAWIWGGFIARSAFGSQSDPTIKFVFGLKKIVKEEGRLQKHYQFRAFKNNQELDKIEFKSFASSISDVRTLGNRSLALDDIIVFEVPCRGGCGCTGGELINFWNGRKFSVMEELMGVGDAWASTSISFIYPTDMEGEANYIIKESRNYEEEGLADNQIRRFITKSYYRWNGSKLMLDSSRKEQVKSYIYDIE